MSGLLGVSLRRQLGRGPVRLSSEAWCSHRVQGEDRGVRRELGSSARECIYLFAKSGIPTVDRVLEFKV